MSEFLYDEEVFRIRGAIFEVHNHMGNGFLESVYQECLGREFLKAGIPFEPQRPLIISYKGEALNQSYQPDFVCFDKIILEIKAVASVVQAHQAQVINYLKVTGFRVGLLANFGTYPQAQIKRFVF